MTNKGEKAKKVKLKPFSSSALGSWEWEVETFYIHGRVSIVSPKE